MEGLVSPHLQRERIPVQGDPVHAGGGEQRPVAAVSAGFRREMCIRDSACTVTVTAASAPDITSSVASGGSVTFDESKFNSACTEVYGNKLNYVTFTLPSSSRGTLYYLSLIHISLASSTLMSRHSA